MRSREESVGIRDASQYVRDLWPLLRGARGRLLIVVLVLLGTTAFALLPPFVSGRMMDAIVQRNLNVLLILLVVQIVIGFGRLALAELQTTVTRTFSHACATILRANAVERLHRAVVGSLNDRTLGEIINRLEGDVDGVVGALLGILPLATAAVSLVWLAVMLPLTEWHMAVVAYICLPLWALTFLPVGRRVAIAGFQTGKARDSFLTILAESVSLPGLLRVKSFVKHDDEKSKIVKHYESLFTLQRRHYLAARSTTVWQTAVTTFAPAILTLVGFYILLRGQCSLGTIAMFTGYFSQTFSPAGELANTNARAITLAVNARRLFELLTLPVESQGGAKTRLSGAIQVDRVSFGFTEPVLTNVNLRIDAGEKVLLTGPSGSGKSTLLRLLMRYYDPVGGQILYDGIDAMNLHIDTLRAQIAYVPQDAQLLSGTIRDNILYAATAGSPTLDDVVAICDMSSMIKALPDGLDSAVDSIGTKLSGGQRQRVAIARALMTNREVLILDEATSALDATTEDRIIERVCELYEGRTIVLVSHRPSRSFRPTSKLTLGGEAVAIS